MVVLSIGMTSQRAIRARRNWLSAMFVRTVLVVVAVGVMAPIARANFSGANGRIAFSRALSDSASPYGFRINLFDVSANGTGERRLTNGTWSDRYPAYSPDGHQIAFDSDRSNPVYDNFASFELYVMRADGSGVRRITANHAYDAMPTWTPDGRIVFYRVGTGGDPANGLWEMNADGTDQHELTRDGGYEPRVSPGGRTIGYLRGVLSMEVNRDGSHPRQIVSFAAGPPDWRPDGRLIAFEDLTHYHLHLARPDGSDERDVFSGLGFISPPVWAPDGTRLVVGGIVHYPTDTTESLYTVRPDGTALQRITQGPEDGSPTWQPVTLPTRKTECRHGGWRDFGDRFRNRRQCIAFVERGRR